VRARLLSAGLLLTGLGGCYGRTPSGDTGDSASGDSSGSGDSGSGDSDSSDTNGGDTDTAPFVWEDTLDPDAVHLLVGSTPGEGNDGHPLEELAADFSPRWALDFGDTSGTAGAIRHPDGSTVYARTWPPPTLTSALEAVDADGARLWSLDSFFAPTSFVHGVVETPDGDFLVADTTQARVVAVDATGAELWELSWAESGAAHWPNGIALATGDDGVTRLAVTLLYEGGDDTSDHVELWRLGARGDVPTREWSWPPEGVDATQTWTHGPQILADGTVTAALAGRGQVVGIRDGAVAWTIPPEPGALGFPRDAVFLPDGSLLLADAASELLRVADPFGAFVVVAARSTPGIYSVGVLDCATDVCLGP